MGLDNIWIDESNNHAYIDKPFNVCGGMCSGNGESSFRGKVYYDYVKDITGVSLYDDIIDNDRVMEMANDLRVSLDQFNDDLADTYRINREDVENLVWMFEEHGNAGHRLVSWW